MVPLENGFNNYLTCIDNFKGRPQLVDNQLFSLLKIKGYEGLGH